MKFNIKKIWKKLGPGLITGSSDDDPSGIATYSQAGAAFGLATLWTAFITFPLMYCIQEMCARIGIVTDCGLMSVIKKRYHKSFLYLLLWKDLKHFGNCNTTFNNRSSCGPYCSLV